MENAVEALKTAAAVLIFVIALTTSFTMFSQAKETADSVLRSQDTQEYLEAAELDNGKLYTSSTSIKGENGESSIAGMTTDGYRIVGVDDVISTIYRYSLEKYGVTLIKSSGEVIARFDSNTENVMRQWYNITDGVDSEGNSVSSEQIKEKFAEQIKNNITVTINNKNINPIIKLEEIYRIEVDGNNKIKCGAPWYGNEIEIIKRINADISQTDYELNNQIYSGKGIKSTLDKAERIVEIVNEIDNSKYLKDGENKTSLLQEYQLPTIEVIYYIID